MESLERCTGGKNPILTKGNGRSGGKRERGEREDEGEIQVSEERYEKVVMGF